MLDSRCFSKAIATLVFGLLLLSSAAGCATVKPQDKEYLAEPSMTYTSGGMTATHEEHVLSNREGSMGGGVTRGGGCGCN